MPTAKLAWSCLALGLLSAACSFSQDPIPGSPASADAQDTDAQDADVPDADAQDADADADVPDADAQDADADLDAPDLDAPDLDAPDLDAPDLDADAQDADADPDAPDLDADQDADAQDADPDAQDADPDAQDAEVGPWTWEPAPDEPPSCAEGSHSGDGAGACLPDAPEGLWARFDAWAEDFEAPEGTVEDESGAGHNLQGLGLAPFGNGFVSFSGQGGQEYGTLDAREVWAGDFALALWVSARNPNPERRHVLMNNRDPQGDAQLGLVWSLHVEGGLIVWQIEREGEVLLKLAGEVEPLETRGGAALVVQRQGGLLQLWVGEREVAQAQLPAESAWAANPLFVGGDGYDPSESMTTSPWSGSLHDLQLYARALSPQEVASLLPREGLPVTCSTGFQDDGEGRCRPQGRCSERRSPAGGLLCLPERGLLRRYAMEQAAECVLGRCVPNEGAGDLPLTLPDDAERASTSGLDSAVRLGAGVATASAENLPRGDDDRSAALWFRVVEQGTFGRGVLLRYGIEGRKVELALERARGRLMLHISAGSRSEAVELPSSAQAWRHLAYTYDDGEVAHRLWLDGREVPLATDLGELDTSLGNEPLTLGPLADLGGGALDEVRVYGRALSAEEAQALYQGGRTTRCLDGWHHDGAGGCAREGLCATSRWHGGDGLCLPVGQCASGHALSQRGACVPAALEADPESCQDIYDAGGRGSGVYELWLPDPASGREALTATYCEQGQGGGWALVARGGGLPGDFSYNGAAWSALAPSLGAYPALEPSDAVLPGALLGGAQELLLVLEHPPGSGRFEAARIDLDDIGQQDDPTLARLLACQALDADLQGLLNDAFLGLDAQGGDSCEAARCNFSEPNGAAILGLQASALDCAPRLLGGVGLSVPNVPLSAGLVQVAPSGFTSWRRAAFYLYAR